jgi:putative Holliday junction resolvase
MDREAVMPGAEVLGDAGAFARVLPAKGSLLGIDASERRLGLAGTDPGRTLVTPLLTLERRGRAQDERRLRQIVLERQAAALVLGLPLNMDGSAGPAARGMQKLARNLAEALNLPVLLQDERLTSFAVEAAVAEGRLSKPRRAGPLDHYAAAVILEDALRAMAEPPPPGPV